MSTRKKYRSNYNSSRSCVYNINFHLVWTTKYRKKILSDNIQSALKIIISEKCTSLNISIRALEIMNDHVHLFISTKPDVNLVKIISIIKGSSSFILRSNFPELKKLKCLWAPSYFCESIGYVSQKNIIKYINNQKY